jgi:hypothetical protein
VASLGLGSGTGGCGGGACWTSTACFMAGAGGEGRAGDGALGFVAAGGAGALCTGGDVACEDPAMSRLVVSATDTVMGGGTMGAAGVIVTWAVGVVGGTNFIICGGRTGAGAGIGAGAGVGAGAGTSGGGAGFRPCNSSFLSSNVAISVLMEDKLCFVSWALPTRSL